MIYGISIGQPRNVKCISNSYMLLNIQGILQLAAIIFYCYISENIERGGILAVKS